VGEEALMQSPPSARRKRRWKRILLAQLVVVLLALALTEITFRIIARAHGRPHDAEQMRAAIEQIQSVNQDFTPRPRGDRQLNEQDNPHAAPILHPYLGFEIIDANQQIDDLLRYTHNDPDPNRLDVLIVGGSVSDMFGQEAYGAGPLRALLAADPRVGKRPINFLQFGRGGFKQPQQLNNVIYLMNLGFKPKIIVNIDGFNEVALGNNNASKGTHPVYPSVDHWAHLAKWGGVDRNSLDIVVALRENQRAIERLTSFALDHGFCASAALSTLTVLRLQKLRSECVREFELYTTQIDDPEQRTVVRGPKFEGDTKTAVAACTRSWSESSRILADICRARSILYLHVLQPTLHDVGSKKLTQTEIDQGGANQTWIDGVHIGYPLMRKLGAVLAKQGVDFVDATQIFADETGDIYFDCCHFGPQGNQILAKKVATELLARWDRVR
jgi:hypothetical protein